MAKIIEHGNLYNKTIVCKSCGCKFIAEKEDHIYPTINMDEVCDDGCVHINELIALPGLIKKNALDKFYLIAEIFEYRAPHIICPECGEYLGQQNELVLFEFTPNCGDEIIVTDDIDVQEKLESYDFGDDEINTIIDSTVNDGTYECYSMHMTTKNFTRVKVPVKRIILK